MCNCNNSCGCTPPTSCDCPTFLRSDCVSFSQDLTCSSIPKDLTLTDTIIALDAYICSALSEMNSKINLINIGTGVQIYAGIDNLGKRKIRTLTSVDDSITIELAHDGVGETNENNINLSITADYAVDSTVVHLADPETITGDKTFSAPVTAVQYNLSALNTAPISAVDIGTTGEIRFVNGFIYVCVANNSWQRVAIAAW